MANKVQKSDHFDGNRFFNPGEKHRESIFDLFRVMYAMFTSKNWEKPTISKVEPNFAQNLSAGQYGVTFINHATFMIQTAGLTLLTDPVWSKRASPFSWAGPARWRPPGVEFDTIPKVDVVLLSHNHYDHMDVATLRKLNQRFEPLFLVALGDQEKLEAIGIENVKELDWWESVAVSNELTLTFTPSKHFSSRGLFDRDKSLWGSFMLKSSGRKLYFGGDTGYGPHFKEIEQRLGAPDIALLPIGAYEPYWFMSRVHMNPQDAVLAHIDLKSKRSLGMHFGTFKLTTEPIDEPVKALMRSLTQLSIDLQTFTIPTEGKTEIY